MHYSDQVKALLGDVAPPQRVLGELARARGLDDCHVTRCDALRLAADAAEWLAVQATTDADVTAVEDISVDARRKIDVFTSLAARLGERADACDAETAGDAGPFVVPFREWGRAEATEW